MPTTFGWVESHHTLQVALLAILALLLLNLLAYWHARKMTRRYPCCLQTSEHQVPARNPGELGLRYEEHILVGDIGPLQAWFVPHSKAQALVVLCHGYRSCKVDVLPACHAFHQLGYACFLFDFRGAGKSAGSWSSIGYHEANDILRTLEYVDQLWGDLPIILFGHSMGAASILRALTLVQAGDGRSTTRVPDPEAVILEAPFDRLLNAVGTHFNSLGMPSFPYAHLLIYWGGAQQGYNTFAYNPADYARRIYHPVLLMNGTEDQQASPRQVHAVYHNLPTPKQLHTFQGMGHQLFVTGQPDEWKEVVSLFLTHHVPTPRTGSPLPRQGRSSGDLSSMITTTSPGTGSPPEAQQAQR